MSNKCPICSRDSNKIVSNSVITKVTSGERLKVGGRIPISVLRCEDCELDFLETWNDRERAYRFYENDRYVYKPNIIEENRKFNEYEYRFNLIKPYLSEDTRLLEIGCGEGIFLRQARTIVSDPEGCEITVAHVNALREDGFKIWDCPAEDIEPEYSYDILCMFALLEHVPLISDFLNHLKTFSHGKSHIFIEVPNLLDPLVSYYDVSAYRDFYYREYHLYYFTPKSLRKLLNLQGFECEIWPTQQASLTNHFHWMHKGRGQANTNEMVNVTLPKALINNNTSGNKTFEQILDEVDDFYRQILLNEGIGDLLSCHAWPKNL